MSAVFANHRQLASLTRRIRTSLRATSASATVLDVLPSDTVVGETLHEHVAPSVHRCGVAATRAPFDRRAVHEPFERRHARMVADAAGMRRLGFDAAVDVQVGGEKDRCRGVGRVDEASGGGRSGRQPKLGTKAAARGRLGCAQRWEIDVDQSLGGRKGESKQG